MTAAKIVCRFCGQVIAERSELTREHAEALAKVLRHNPFFEPSELARLVFGISHLLTKHPETAKAIGRMIAEFAE
jgi:hypothetical protein